MVVAVMACAIVQIIARARLVGPLQIALFPCATELLQLCHLYVQDTGYAHLASVVPAKPDIVARIVK